MIFYSFASETIHQTDFYLVSPTDPSWYFIWRVFNRQACKWNSFKQLWIFPKVKSY